jgi:biotin transport system substrate-specific component
MQTAHPARVISAAVLPRTTAASAALVVGFALLTALMAQIRIPLGFTPVNITGQTFAVLLSGAALGAGLGAASQGLYIFLGLFLPFYQGGESGWAHAKGATGGYLVGFVVAAWFVGVLAERRQDRDVATAIPAFLAGNAIIHLMGVPWLAHVLDVSWERAAELGSYPFIAGDLIKIALAGLLLPVSWRYVNHWRGA